METSVSERIITVVLTLITIGSVAGLTYFLVTAETVGMSMPHIVIDQQI
ncbi:MAG: hypothetical protein HC769_26940 [Cyanobacteria bacterium CRU_2_1]|nr:hypothetical protein [Cyanobacteria bacterium RU_5_0]NJR62139.1 hypothetical protein [Cyanobacteria bacterium CRU_2_1]